MPAFQLRIKPRDLGRYEARLSRIFVPAQRVGARAGARAAVMLLKRLAQMKRIKDTGAFASGWQWRQEGDEVVIFNRAGHAIYVERGRRPGARPPPAAALYGWLERHGIHRAAAWPIARAIGKRGIKPRPVMTSEQFLRVADKLFFMSNVVPEVDRAFRRAKR